jgi:hypothetical protein
LLTNRWKYLNNEINAFKVLFPKFAFNFGHKLQHKKKHNYSAGPCYKFFENQQAILNFNDSIIYFNFKPKQRLCGVMDEARACSELLGLRVKDTSGFSVVLV